MSKNKQSPWITFLVIVIMGSMPQIATDMYTPSLPAIATYFGTDVNIVQFSLSLFMFSLAISQLFYGPLVEAIGRKKTILLGLSISLIGCLICLTAFNVEALLVGRFIQGLGAGACAATWRAIFRDSYSGTDLSKYGSYLSNFCTFTIVAAPFIGAHLQAAFDWRSVFAALLIYAILTIFIVCLLYQESGKDHHASKLKKDFIVASYKELLKSPLFIGYCLCVFLGYGGLIAWLTAGPVILIKYVGISPVQFGYLMLISGLAIFLTSIVNGKLVGKYGHQAMLYLGWACMLVSGLMMGLLYFVVGMNVYTVMLPVALFYFGVSFIWPNAVAGAFTPFGHIAGYAAGLYSFMQIAGGAFFSLILAYMDDSNPLPLSAMFIGSAVLGFLVYRVLVKPKVVPV